MKDSTDKKKAFICGFNGIILATVSLFPGETSNENLLSAQYNIDRFNGLIEYFGVNSNIRLIDPNEVFVSNDKVINLLKDTSRNINKSYSYFVLSAFMLGKSAALIFQRRYCGHSIDEETLQEFNNECQNLSIDEQTRAIFLETLEPITFVKEFHKSTQISSSKNMSTDKDKIVSQTFNIAGAYIEKNTGTYIQNINMSQDLTHVAEQIQSSIDHLQQQQGKSPEEAQAKVAQDIAIQSQKDPTAKEKLIKLGESIGTATVTDVAKGAVKLAIRLAGIPIP
jgi:hypothetical protein